MHQEQKVLLGLSKIYHRSVAEDYSAKKYEVIPTSGKWNTIYLEQAHITDLTTVVNKPRYDNLNIFKPIKKTFLRKKGSETSNSQAT